MDIAIIQSIEDLDRALTHFKPQETLWISVSCAASYYLTKRNIQFSTDEDILSPDECISIGNQNFTRVEKWIHRLESTLQSQNRIFKDRDFYPFQWHSYRLKILLDTITIPWAILSRLMDIEKPHRIGVSKGADPSQIHNSHLFFEPNESVYGMLASEISKRRNIELQIWDPPENSADIGRFPYYRMLFKSIICHPEKILGHLSRKKALLYFNKKKPNLLIGNTGYDIGYLLKALTDRFNFYYYNNFRSLKSLNKTLKNRIRKNTPKFSTINISNCFNSVPVTGDVGLDQLFGKRIQSYANKYLPVLWKEFNYLEYLDHKKNFKAFLNMTGSSDAFMGLIVHYFNKVKKPVIVVQHGSYGFAPNSMTTFSDFGHNGYFLAWGSGVSEMYDNIKKGKCTIIPTGSHLIETIVRKRKVRKAIKKVCYLPFVGGIEYYPNGLLYRDSKVFMIKTAILNTLKQFVQQYDITYKVAPGLLRKDVISRWCQENVQGINIDGRPLRWIIHEFDFFIIDFPSTALVQTLASGAEVLVYTGIPYYELTHAALELLKQRAIVGIDEKDFIEKIKIVLDKAVVTSDVENMAFLYKYGVHLNENKSLERMADIVQTACNLPLYLK